MPNWCDCELRVEGNKLDLKRFKKFAKTGKVDLDTEKFIPYPDKFKQIDKKAKKGQNKWHKLKPEERKDIEYPNDSFNLNPEKDKDKLIDGMNGYTWCSVNWGTKWGLCNTDLGYINLKYSEMEYTFETAWSPPLPVILAMSKKFKRLEFTLRYFECGAGFNGLFRCKAGKVLDNQSGEYFGSRGG